MIGGQKFTGIERTDNGWVKTGEHEYVKESLVKINEKLAALPQVPAPAAEVRATAVALVPKMVEKAPVTPKAEDGSGISAAMRALIEKEYGGIPGLVGKTIYSSVILQKQEGKAVPTFHIDIHYAKVIKVYPEEADADGGRRRIRIIVDNGDGRLVAIGVVVNGKDPRWNGLFQPDLAGRYTPDEGYFNGFGTMRNIARVSDGIPLITEGQVVGYFMSDGGVDMWENPAPKYGAKGSLLAHRLVTLK